MRAYLASSPRAPGGGETDSAMRWYIPTLRHRRAATMFHIAYCHPSQDFAPTQGRPNALGIVGRFPSTLSERQRGRPRRELDQRKGIKQS